MLNIARTVLELKLCPGSGERELKIRRLLCPSSPYISTNYHSHSNTYILTLIQFCQGGIRLFNLKEAQIDYRLGFIQVVYWAENPLPVGKINFQGGFIFFHFFI